MPFQIKTRPDGQMPKGLEVEDLQVGEGRPAQRGDLVDVRFTTRLSRGDLDAEGVYRGLLLGSRRAYAGFERGIEGMQVGGRRRLKVPPHLSYRDGKLRICELELLAITEYKR